MSKTPLLIVSRDERIGDAVEAWPCIHALAEQFKDESEIYLALSNREVGKIMKWPDNVTDILAAEPNFAWSEADVIVLGAGAAINFKFGPTVLHLSQMFYVWAGLEPPELVPVPELNVPPSVNPLDFDYLIAPFSKDNNRSITLEETQMLIDELPWDSNIGILGAASDPKPFKRGLQDEYNDGDGRFEYLYGFSLGAVVNLMRDCKRAVITSDSAISRLAHAAQIRNHVLLAKPIVTPIQWQAHPGCRVVCAIPDNFFGSWRLTDVMDAVHQAEKFKVAAGE